MGRRVTIAACAAAASACLSVPDPQQAVPTDLLCVEGQEPVGNTFGGDGVSVVGPDHVAVIDRVSFLQTIVRDGDGFIGEFAPVTWFPTPDGFDQVCDMGVFRGESNGGEVAVYPGEGALAAVVAFGDTACRDRDLFLCTIETDADRVPTNELSPDCARLIITDGNGPQVNDEDLDGPSLVVRGGQLYMTFNRLDGGGGIDVFEATADDSVNPTLWSAERVASLSDAVSLDDPGVLDDGTMLVAYSGELDQLVVSFRDRNGTWSLAKAVNGDTTGLLAPELDRRDDDRIELFAANSSGVVRLTCQVRLSSSAP